MSIKWYKYFVEMADLVASKSKDESTKVGAVIIDDDYTVISTGYNGLPRGVNDNDPGRQTRPIKYMFFEHAERNAIYNAARNGHPLKGSTMILNFEPCPCADCTRAVIQSGIKRVVGYKDRKFPGSKAVWGESMRVSREMMREAGIEVVGLEGRDFRGWRSIHKDLPTDRNVEIWCYFSNGVQEVVKVGHITHGLKTPTHWIELPPPPHHKNKSK